MSSKVYFSEIALIRPILIFSIIIGHSFAVFTDSAWWPLPIGMHTNDVLRCINPIVISFALQAFVFISGFLFSYKSDKLLTSWAEKTKFILAKFKRIYIPSLIFSTIYLLCFDTFSIESIYDIIESQIGSCPPIEKQYIITLDTGITIDIDEKIYNIINNILESYRIDHDIRQNVE